MSATVTPKKRGRPPLHHLGAGMYFDYCTGLSIDQVAQKWGVTPSTVRGRFHAMRLPLRRAPKGCNTCGANRNPHDIGHVSFEDANRTRTRVANRVTVARAAE